MIRATGLILAALVLLSGCASMAKPGDTGDISILGITCSRPYELAQDCNWELGPRRGIVIRGHAIRIAGSASGDVVWVTDENAWIEGLDMSLFTADAAMGAAAEASLDAVSALLDQEGIRILTARPVRYPHNNTLQGHILVLDQDAYSILKGYAPSK